MKDKIIQFFTDKYVYESYIDWFGKELIIKTKKIKVIAEVVTHGASISTYIVKYQDGCSAYVPKNMYSE